MPRRIEGLSIVSVTATSVCRCWWPRSAIVELSTGRVTSPFCGAVDIDRECARAIRRQRRSGQRHRSRSGNRGNRSATTRSGQPVGRGHQHPGREGIAESNPGQRHGVRGRIGNGKAERGGAMKLSSRRRTLCRSIGSDTAMLAPPVPAIPASGDVTACWWCSAPRRDPVPRSPEAHARPRPRSRPTVVLFDPAMAGIVRRHTTDRPLVSDTTSRRSVPAKPIRQRPSADPGWKFEGHRRAAFVPKAHRFLSTRGSNTTVTLASRLPGPPSV